MMVKKVFAIPAALFLALLLHLPTANAQDGAPQATVAVNEATASISGILTDGTKYADKVVVYVYQKGALDAAAETQMHFKNAVASAEIQADGAFELAGLEAGTYELFFAAYEADGQGESFDLKGALALDEAKTVDLRDIVLGTGDAIQLDLTATGILQL